MQTTWPGYYLDGKTADKEPVRVELSINGLKLTLADGTAIYWSYQEIRQVAGFYGNDPVRFEKGSDIPEILIVEDHEFLIHLHEFTPQKAQRFHNPARRSARFRLTLLAAVAVAAITVFVYAWGIPFAASVITPYVPVAWEAGLGKSALNVLAPEDHRCRNPKLTAALQQMVLRLTEKEKIPYNISIYVTDTNIVNAVALPGGSIVVFRGLLEKTKSPDALAGVLAHEIQHITRRHATKRIIADSSTGLILSAVSGDVTGAVVYGAKIAHNLAMLSYSRKDEEEADREGMKMLLSVGIDPGGLIGFFESLQEKDAKNANVPRVLKYLATHPDTAERIAKMKAAAAASPRPSSPAFPRLEREWDRIKKDCKGK